MLRIQKKINEEARSKFIDFLICTAYVVNVSNDTVHVAMLIADRYLLVKSLERQKIMAFEITCLIISSNMYEVDGAAPLAAELANQIEDFEEYTKTEVADIV